MNQLFTEVGIPFLEWSVAAGGAVVALNQVWLWRQRRSDIMRETYEIFFPSTMTHEKVLNFIRSLSACLNPTGCSRLKRSASTASLTSPASTIT